MKRYTPTATTFRSDVLVSFSTGIISRVVTFAALAVITRTYASQDYGLWLLILSLATLFLPLCTLRYEIALVLAPTDALAKGLFLGIVGAILGAVTIVTILVIVIPSRAFSALTGVRGDPSGFLWIIPLTLLLVAVNALMQSWLTRTKQFGWLGTAQAIQMAVTAIITVALPFLIPPNVKAAAIGALSGFCVSIALMIWVGANELSRTLRIGGRYATVREALHEYRVYPFYVFPYSLSLLLSERILQIALVSSYSIAVLGSFLVARQFFQAPAVLLMSTVRNVLLAHGSRSETIDATRMRSRQLLALLTVLAAPALAGGTIWVGRFSSWAFGTTWPLLSEISWWQMFAGCMLVFSGPLDRLFDLAKRQKTAVALQVMSDVTTIVVLFAAISLGLSAPAAIAYISVTYVLCQCTFLWFALRAIGICTKESLWIYFRFLLYYFPVLLLVAISDRALPQIPALLLSCLVVGTIIGFGLWRLRREVVELRAASGKGMAVAANPL